MFPNRLSKLNIPYHLPCGILSLFLAITVGVSLLPIFDHLTAQRDATALVARAQKTIADSNGPMLANRYVAIDKVDFLQSSTTDQVLASWGNVGGCGAGGGTSAGGGIKWVGRGVTGGLVDLQCIGTQSFYLDGSLQTSLSTRIGTHIGDKWIIGTTVPFRYNLEEIKNPNDETVTARLPGWGDVSLEVGRKLGITNAGLVSLNMTVPTGSYDAVREGVILPQRMQLGTGTIGAGLTAEYSIDKDWGLMIVGLSANFGGWQNKVDNLTASSISGYYHVGMMLGPFYPSVGITLNGKLYEDKDGQVPIVKQPMLMAPVNASIEWSSDYLAIIASVSTPINLYKTDGWSFDTDSWLVGLGVQASVF